MKNLIEAKNISKTFYGKDSAVHALIDVDLTVETEDTVGILGISGSGKRTLLHILGTLDRPPSGEVVFDGMNLFNYDDDELSKIRNNKIGFVFQFHYLLPEFSVLENVMLPARKLGKKTTEEIEFEKAYKFFMNLIVPVKPCVLVLFFKMKTLG